jgi:hypothetical protein
MPLLNSSNDMDYALAKQLKENGLRWSTVDLFDLKKAENYPTLEELIAAVPKNIGKATFVLGSANQGTEWVACYFDFVTNRGSEFNESGNTPSEAVGRLWLALNKHE